MQLNSKTRLRKCCTYLGIALMFMPNELSWYWGNLVVYVDSYYYAYKPEVKNDTPWLLALLSCSWGFGILVGAYLLKRFQQFHIAVSGVVIFDAGMLGSYWAVQQSMHLLNFSMGVVCGFGFGLIQAIVFLWVKDLSSSSNVAFAYTLVANCLNIGGIVLNSMITLYINPDNLEARLRVGPTKLFAETSLLDRVPSVFLILGSITFAFHFMGLFLVRIAFLNGTAAYANQQNEPGNDTDVKDHEKAHGCGEQQILEVNSAIYSADIHDTSIHKGIDTKMTSPEKSVNFSHADANGSEKRILNGTPGTWYSGATNEDRFKIGEEQNEVDNDIGVGDIDLPIQGLPNEDNNKITMPEDPKSLTLKQTIKEKAFYALYLTLLSADMCYLSVLTYYKKFGELWIRDDDFLMSIGTASPLAVFLTSMLYALAIQRYGVKCVTVICVSCISILFFTYFIVVRIQLLYAICTVLFSTMTAALYVLLPISALKIFGSTHFSDNYGAVMATSIINNLIAPIVIDVTLKYLGWFGLFLGLGGLNAVIVITNILALPNVC